MHDPRCGITLVLQENAVLLRVGKAHPDVLKTPPALVLFKEFGDSALIFDLLVWISQGQHPNKRVV